MTWKKWMISMLCAFLSFSVLVATGCTRKQNSNLTVDVPDDGESKVKQINMQSKSDSSVKGLIKFSDSESGLLINVSLTGLRPNSTHGFHIHEFGDCSGKGAEAAGEHFKPEPTMVHGSLDTPNHHAGDLGNLVADGKGNVMVNLTATQLSLKHQQGRFSVENLAVIVHEKPDDLTTQPSGNSGDRIACGIVR